MLELNYVQRISDNDARNVTRQHCSTRAVAARTVEWKMLNASAVTEAAGRMRRNALV